MVEFLPGQSGQADFVSSQEGSGIGFNHWVVANTGGDVATSAPPAPPGPPYQKGWSATITGSVSVPSDAAYGVYSLRYGVYLGIINQAPRERQDNYEFEIICLKVSVSLSQGSSAPIAGTSPQQYRHTFSASAVAKGGTAPISYAWSTGVGSFAPSPSSSDSTATIEVTNTSPNVSGLTGSVTCTATDSDSPACTDTDSADVSGAGAPTEGPGPTVPPSGGPPSSPISPDGPPGSPPGSPPGGPTCSADGATTMTLSKNLQTTGNNTVSSGSSPSVLTLR